MRPPPSRSPNPSSDCRKATTPVEKLICSDPKLGELDRKMAEAFRQRFEQVPVTNRDAILKRQRRWLQARANAFGLDIALPGFRRILWSFPRAGRGSMGNGYDITGQQITEPTQQIEVLIRGELADVPVPTACVPRRPTLWRTSLAAAPGLLARHRGDDRVYKDLQWRSPNDGLAVQALGGLGVDVVEADLDQNGEEQLLIDIAQLVYSPTTNYALPVSPETAEQQYSLSEYCREYPRNRSRRTGKQPTSIKSQRRRAQRVRTECATATRVP